MGLQHWSTLLPGADLRILSVDAAVCHTMGDLGGRPNLELLIAMARKGLFCAVIAGPPCETWSAARLHLHRPFIDIKNAPAMEG